MKPLSPASTTAYNAILTRAFGDAGDPSSWQVAPEIAQWKHAVKLTLRAAVARRCREQKIDPAPLLEQIPLEYQVRKEVWIPTEAEADAYERAANEMLSPSEVAIAILPLKLGLRANEVLGLSRESVVRAVQTGQLLVNRKGGKEQRLPVSPALREQLKALLDAPAKRARINLEESTATQLKRKRVWQHVGDILSSGKRVTQYQALYALVRRISEAAGTVGHPHSYRHAFATEMNRRGAPLATIQRALGHANPTVTARYVHPSDADVAKFIGE